MNDLTLKERDAILEFLESLKEAAEKAERSYRDAKGRSDSEMLQNGWVYWRNVKSGMRWAIGQVHQRTKGVVQYDGRNVQ